MPTTVESEPPTLLRDASLLPRGAVHPSPVDWRDQILYFLLPDRFCDNQSAARPLFDRNKPLQFASSDKAGWMAAGKSFQRGTIQGIRGRLPYLKNLGVTALWIGPVWKQRPDLDTYHGYGIQNFLEVDRRFGTRQDLRELIDEAHQIGMYVLLDVIVNHTGNNWFYDDGGTAKDTLIYRYQPPYRVHGWRSAAGQSVPNIATLDDGVWPQEFQTREWYTRAGKIEHWDPASWENPMDPRTEFRRGDFFDLKDLHTSEDEPFVRDAVCDQVLSALVKVYQYWIALTDCDGFRVDTVKHVSFEASRNFCGAIHEYAESIGKQNFLILGEVAGGAAMSRSYLDIFGRNLDAALDLGQPMDTLTRFAKGVCDPLDFFRQFGGHDAIGSHREVGRYHVSVLDDHDMIERNPKRRFSAQNTIPARYEQVAHAVGIQLTTLGIPCIYYGTEQAFDGWQGYHDEQIEPVGSDGKPPFADRYVRESMFGGTFGAFQTSGCHFFDERHPAYMRIAAIARVVTRHDKVGMALRRGRQYARETRFDSAGYVPPRQGELVAWSRLLFDQEVLVAVNTHGTEGRGAFVTVDAALHPPGSVMQAPYRGDWTDAELLSPPLQTVNVSSENGRAVVRVDLPPAGMAIFA
jgi:glycosidase